MKILHCCLACFYIENYNYQENILPKCHKEMGHDVKIITSTEVFGEGNQLVYIEPIRYTNKYDIEVVRLPYSHYFPKFLAKKIRKYNGLYEEIEKFSPDIIYMHGMQTLDLKSVIRYKKKHQEVILYADSHEDFNNSATNFFSKNILHRCFYLPIIKNALSYISKILYISYETKIFLESLYHIDESMLEYFPLGGIIFDETTREIKRNKIRSKYKLKSGDILIVHSGKMDEGKKTKELILSFSKVLNDQMKLIILGQFDKKYGEEVMPLINEDKRILFEGWKDGEELLEYLCACDLYAQPGSQSATMQNALCCGSAIMISSVLSHRYLLGEIPFYADSIEDMIEILSLVSSNRNILDLKRAECFELAKEKLDYRKLAEQIITGFHES